MQTGTVDVAANHDDASSFGPEMKGEHLPTVRTLLPLYCWTWLRAQVKWICVILLRL